MKLCYVSENWAYFTSQDLDKQWGDDWDDAPYEHNADPPYEFGAHDAAAGKLPWLITKVAFDGQLSRPCDGYLNSCWTVQQINAGGIAWLRGTCEITGLPVVIPAGCSLGDFCALVQQCGGTVYLPC